MPFGLRPVGEPCTSWGEAGSPQGRGQFRGHFPAHRIKDDRIFAHRCLSHDSDIVNFISHYCIKYGRSSVGRLGSRVVSVLDSGAERPGFKSQPRRCRVTVLDKLFTPIVPLFTKQQNW